jgi:hypothetical protein
MTIFQDVPTRGKPKRPTWATTAAVACAIGIVGLLSLGAGYVSLSVAAIGVGVLACGAATIAALLAGFMYFMEKGR